MRYTQLYKMLIIISIRVSIITAGSIMSTLLETLKIISNCEVRLIINVAYIQNQKLHAILCTLMHQDCHLNDKRDIDFLSNEDVAFQ